MIHGDLASQDPPPDADDSFFSLLLDDEDFQDVAKVESVPSAFCMPSLVQPELGALSWDTLNEDSSSTLDSFTAVLTLSTSSCSLSSHTGSW